MRGFAQRRIALVLVVAPMLVACGVLLDTSDDVVAPDRVDGGSDGGSDGVASQDGGPGDPDAIASEAGGDACATAAVCAPERLATLSGGVLRLVVAGSTLYAGHSGAAAPKVASLASGAPGPVLDLDPQATVPDNFRGDSSIAVDSSGAIYWGTPNGLRRREANAGLDASTDAGVTELSALGAPVSGVRIAADGRLHFTVNNPLGAAPNGGHLASCAVPGCTDVQTSYNVRYPQDVIAIGASRWWLGATDADFNVILRAPGMVLSGVQNIPSRMVTDGAHIFWSAVENLRMFTIGGAAPTDLLAADTTVTTRVNGIALDPAGTLYVTQQSNVLRCTIVAGKCSLTNVATTPGIATDVAADATHVYWGTTDGSVWRLRKP